MEVDDGLTENGLVLQAIRQAAVAGGLIAYARKDPGAARGLMKAAAHHEGRVEALLSEFLAGTQEGDPAPRLHRDGR